MTRVFAGGVLATLLLSSAAAQVPEQIFRDFFGTLLPQIQRQLAPPTGGPPRIAPSPEPSPARVLEPHVSTSRPTFDCTKARSPLAVLICSDGEVARADWDLVTASWARYFSLNEKDRPKFTEDQDNWFASVARKCKLASQRPPFAREQISCVAGAYRERAAAYRSKLASDALAESRLSPGQLVQIQQGLITLGFLEAEADGEFGPTTRDAIQKFQQANGFPQSNFLAKAQRQALLDGSAGTTGLGGHQSAAPESRPPAVQDTPAAGKFARMAGPTGGMTWKECELADRDPDRSIAACSKLLRANRVKSGAFHNRGLANAAKGNLDRAIADISEGIRLDPGRAYRWQERGELYLRQGNSLRAIADFDEAIRLDPTRAFRFNQRGHAYRASGDLTKAIADYSEAIRLDPIKRLFRFYDRGNVLRDTGQYERALADYETALELEPRNAWVLLERGRTYAKIGQTQFAARDFDAALAIEPLNLELRAAIQAETAQASIPPLDPSVKKPPPPEQPTTPFEVDPRQETRQKAENGDAKAQFELGTMYKLEKEYGQAVIWFRKAAERGHADAQYHLGYMYDNGQGVPEDGGEANIWFQKAAAKGQADAKIRLGEAASIIQLARSTMDRSQQELVHVRGTEARGQIELIIAQLAAANDKMPVSDLHALKNEAQRAVQILDEAREFRRVSQIASDRIAVIERQLERITSDASIVLEIRSAIGSLKAEQSGSRLISLQDALRKLNQLYDNNREELKRLEFDVY